MVNVYFFSELNSLFQSEVLRMASRIVGVCEAVWTTRLCGEK